MRRLRLGRLVAIKFLLEHSGPGAQRFLAEARATARCRHENIVVIHEVDEVHGYPYMVLEFIEGRTLRAWMEQRMHPGGFDGRGAAPGPVSPSLAVELMVPAVRALVCAHRTGIVHRDLKPENILLSDSGVVKVVDFGIAKRLGAEAMSMVTGLRNALSIDMAVTQKGMLVGTLPYMSPEQLRSEDIDARSDLWAVGIILHELCTGLYPFEPFTHATLRRIANLDEPMPSVSMHRSDLGVLG